MIVWYAGCTLHIRQSSTQSDKYQVSQEKKEPTDDTGTNVYSQLVLSQHVSGIIMPVVRRTDCIKPRVVLAWIC